MTDSTNEHADVEPHTLTIESQNHKCMEWTNDGRVLVYAGGKLIGEFTKRGFVGVDE